MLDHIGVAVSNTARSKEFYKAALAPLGITLLAEFGGDVTESGGSACGFGKDRKPFFWIGDNAKVGEGVHVAFAAESRDVVKAFYEAAMGAGGKDNGAPGPRPHYHPDYYGAFVQDPDGHNIEAVCRVPG